MAIGAAILILITSPLFYFNVIVDPFGVFLDHNEYIYFTNENNKRYGKIKYLLKYPDRFQNFIFGSSRVNFIDPDLFGNEQFFNMTYSAGMPGDHLRDIRIMIEGGVKVKRVIVGVDFLSFFTKDMTRKDKLLRYPYPITIKDHYEFYKLYLLNIPQKGLIERNIGDYRKNRQEPIGNGSIVMKEQDEFIDNNPTAHIRKRKFRIPTSIFRNPQDFSDGLRYLGELISFLKEHNIDYVLFINPTQSATYLTLNLEAYMDLLRGMSEITSFFDFSGLNSVCINNMNFMESSHFRKRTGDMIVKRIEGRVDHTVPDDFGYLITEKNIEQHIVRHQNWLEDYFNCISLNQVYWHSVIPDPSLIRSYPVEEVILKIDEKKRTG